MGWRIVNWEKHYEVNSKNQPAREGDTLRRGRLDYIRLKSYGKRQSVAYRQLLAEAKGSGIARIYGIFCKFLEIAGDAEGGERGVLRNQHDEPATAKEIAFMIGCPERQVQNAIEVLCWPGVTWLEPVGVPESPGIPEKLPSTQTQTQTQNNSDSDSDKEKNKSAQFERFWEAYPRKINKIYAKKCFVKLKPTDELLETMLQSIRAALDTRTWRKDELRYIPHPSKWLNQGGWTSEYTPIDQPKSPSKIIAPRGKYAGLGRTAGKATPGPKN